MQKTKGLAVAQYSPRAMKRCALLVIASALFGVLYGLVFAEGVIFGLINGVMNGIAIGLLDTVWVRKKWGRRLRQLPLLVYTLVLSLVWTLVIVINMTLTRHWTGLDHDWGLQWMQSSGFLGHFLFCLFLAFTFNLLIRVSDFLGSHSLLEILLGVYQEPVEQHLAFLFLDVVGSTRLIEQVGDVAAQKMIGKLFFEIAGIVDRFEGEVHRYIGDGMVVSWDLNRVTTPPDILACLAEIYRVVDSRRHHSESTGTLFVDIRAGLNDGPVLICEFGDQKRELVYFGDAINVAAALEAHCKHAGVRAAISSQLYNQLPPSDSFQTVGLGAVTMKGKLQSVECLALNLLELKAAPNEAKAAPEPGNGYGRLLKLMSKVGGSQ
ncbi:adenylate/guanylate cyclase domain-containing protein [Aestuariirhabdus sp. LZHN29]|uniref:adenylate/guanylate cyclase domain-containing protein n=1 Tax=Aestuariirhabdus sp. LZHN29 TaxID=3417462 RepID=UPI003CE6BC17